MSNRTVRIILPTDTQLHSQRSARRTLAIAMSARDYAIEGAPQMSRGAYRREAARLVKMAHTAPVFLPGATITAA